MKNPEPELVTMRCPCDNPNPCCSQVLTSPNKFISVLFWDCDAITDEAATEDLESIREILNPPISISEEDE